MLDVISIGDTTVDVFLDIDEANVHCNINKEDCELCLNYADKIPVNKITRIHAVGNAANNAVGSARLGLRTAIYTIIGDDMDGRMNWRRLREEKVSSEYIHFDKKRGTNYSTVLSFKGERTILVYHEPRNYKLPRLAKSSWVYFSSVSKGGEVMHTALLKYLLSFGALLAFNPGTFQMKLGLEKLKPIFRATEILFLNKEEAERILNQKDHIRELLPMLRQYGPNIVVITDGQNGSYAFDGERYYELPILARPVVERTGAGDSYATAFVAARAHGYDVAEAMRWGSANAASVVQYVGAQAGLLSKSKLLAMLKKHPEFRPTVT